MKVVYILGPYRASTEWEVTQNIRRAEAAALAVWSMGMCALCPHKNTAYFGGAADDSIWIEGGVELVRRCDAVLCIDGWERSAGSQVEHRAAVAAGVPVYLSLEELRECRSRV